MKKTILFILAFFIATGMSIYLEAQRRVTPVDTSKELKIVTKEELKEMRKRAKAEQEFADSVTRDSLKLDSIKKSKQVVRPLLMSASFGANIWDPLNRALGRDYGGGELWAALNLKNRYIPVAEIGFGMANSTPDEGNYTYKGKPAIYAKIGMNYNFMYAKDPKYQFYLGVRAAWSAFKYDITNISISNGYWGQTNNFDILDQSSHATWGEVVAGIQVGLFKNFAMGWTVRYNFLFNIKDNKNSRPWYIPGFGTRDSKLNVGISLIYTLPLSKEQEIKNVMENDGHIPSLPEKTDSGTTEPDSIVIPEREDRVNNL